MVTHWNRRPTRWTVPLLVVTAVLAVAAVVVHVIGLSQPALNSTGGLRNILWFATFVMGFVTYLTARRR
ncbi:hypothetical protein KVA01_04980 [Kocuria varians]|uniref:Cell division protein CrgA n=1 Tax=Kocuria varians TaxID=1272 RepID=A0A4Y4D450_KOCVA|nr:hypothetical protein [Kocuria varians]GEC98343.1 hypothetical protein KVA01_04980 [Kocuria varians]